MTQEYKDLLLTDLCSRLRYGVKCNVGDDKPYTLCKIKINDKNSHILEFKEKKDGLNMQVYLSEVKPYLFPLSSMTEEQKEDLLIHILGKKDCKHFQVLSDGSIDSTDAKQQELEYFNFRWVNFNRKTTSAYIDWCNKNHIDYRNLIRKKLALNATNLKVY